MAETKSSVLNLYSSDNLDNLAFKVECNSNAVNIQSGDIFQIESKKISFVGNADPTKDVDDVAQYLVDREADRATKFAEQDTKNDTNSANITAETTARQSTYDSQAALISSEVTRASGVESSLQGQIDTESSNRLSTYNTLDSKIDQESLDRAAAITNATNAATASINSAKADVTAGDTALNDRLDAILEGSGIDYDTLKEIVDAYQSADTTISATITTLRSDFDALKLKYDTAFPEPSDPNP